MGYDKIKYVAIKGDKVFVTAADGRTVPTRYYRVEFGKGAQLTVEEKMRKVGINIANGYFKPIKSAKCRGVNLYRLGECMSALMEQQQYTSIELDFRWKTDRWQELTELIADLMFLPNIFKAQKNPAKVVDALREFDKESKKVYDQKEQEFAAEDKRPIRCAWSSHVFKGYDVLVDYQNYMSLAKKEDYTTGILKNASQAIDIGPYNCRLASHFIDGVRNQMCDITLKEYLDNGGKAINFKKFAGLTMTVPMFKDVKQYAKNTAS